MLFRVLKMMDFQPRLGTLTQTISAASVDLVHFFIVLTLCFIGFALIGTITFGGSITQVNLPLPVLPALLSVPQSSILQFCLLQFRSLATSLNVCLSGLLGNDSVKDSLIQLTGWQLVAGILYWYSYVIIMFFIVLNLLIAIIVEGFLVVRVRLCFFHAPSFLLTLLI